VGFNPSSTAPLPGDIRLQAVTQNNTQPEKKTKPQVIHSTAADLQKMGNALNKKLQFVVDHNSNEVIVKVIDKETDKVIKVLPPEELQRLHQRIEETFGFLFDQRV